jgi:hypothetical protein
VKITLDCPCGSSAELVADVRVETLTTEQDRIERLATVWIAAHKDHTRATPAAK